MTVRKRRSSTRASVPNSAYGSALKKISGIFGVANAAIPAISLFSAVIAVIIEYTTAIVWARKLGNTNLTNNIFTSMSPDVFLISFGAILAFIPIPFIFGYLAGSFESPKKTNMAIKKSGKIRSLALKCKNFTFWKVPPGRTCGLAFSIFVAMLGSWTIAHDLIYKWPHSGMVAAAIWIITSLLYGLTIYTANNRSGWDFLRASALMLVAQASSLLIYITIAAGDVPLTVDFGLLKLSGLIALSLVSPIAGLMVGLYSDNMKGAMIGMAVLFIVVVAVSLYAEYPQQMLINKYHGVFDNKSEIFLFGGKIKATCKDTHPTYQWSNGRINYFSCHGEYTQNKRTAATNFYGEIHSENETNLKKKILSDKTPNVLITKVLCAPRFINGVPKSWSPVAASEPNPKQGYINLDCIKRAFFEPLPSQKALFFSPPQPANAHTGS